MTRRFVLPLARAVGLVSTSSAVERGSITAQEAADDEEQLEEGVDVDEETDVDEGRAEAAE